LRQQPTGVQKYRVIVSRSCRDVKCGVTIEDDTVDIGACSNRASRSHGIAQSDRDVHRRQTVTIIRVDVGTSSNQRYGNVNEARIDGNMQQRRASLRQMAFTSALAATNIDTILISPRSIAIERGVFKSIDATFTLA
jgi:hypothetical protein